LCCRGGAIINLAPPIRTMSTATAPCKSKRLAALNVAHLRAHAAAAMFTTEAFAIRGGGAARHGARSFLLPATVFDALLGPCSCWGRASIILAPPIRTMPTATAACNSTSLAALNVAHFLVATAVSDTQSS